MLSLILGIVLLIITTPLFMGLLIYTLTQNERHAYLLLVLILPIVLGIVLIKKSNRN